jgi:hypothetical protein
MAKTHTLVSFAFRKGHIVLHGARLRGRKEGKEGRREGRREGKEGRQAQNTKNPGILRHQKRR